MSSEYLPAPLPPEYYSYPTEAGAPQQSWPAQVAEEPRGGYQLERIFSALKRYKWLIAALFVLGLAGGLIATRFVVPQYQAIATVWLGVGGRGTPGASGPVQGTDPMQDAQNWMQLLTSRDVLNAIVQKRQLYLTLDNPADSATFQKFGIGDGFRRGYFRLLVGTDGATYSLVEQTDLEDSSSMVVVERGAVGDSIGRKAGMLWQPDSTVLEAGRSYGFFVTSPSSAALALRGRLVPRIDPRSSVAVITMSGTDPREVSSTLNAVVEEFVATADEVNTRNQYEVIERLDRQVDSASALLIGAEKSLEEYRVRTITQPSEGTVLPIGGGGMANPAMAKYFSLKQQQDGYRQERLALQRVLRDVQSGEISAVAYQGIPSVKGTPLEAALMDLVNRQNSLTQLRLRYTDDHPAVQQELQVVRTLREEQIPQLTESLITGKSVV